MNKSEPFGCCCVSRVDNKDVRVSRRQHWAVCLCFLSASPSHDRTTTGKTDSSCQQKELKTDSQLRPSPSETSPRSSTSSERSQRCEVRHVTDRLVRTPSHPHPPSRAATSMCPFQPTWPTFFCFRYKKRSDGRDLLFEWKMERKQRIRRSLVL